MQSLPVIQPSPPAAPPSASASTWRGRLTGVAMQLYRAGVIILIVWIIHRHHARLRIDGDAPIKIEEVRDFFPAAQKLETDNSPRQGLFVRGAADQPLGYVLRTFPAAEKIIGYCGPTDTLVALSPELKVIGIKMRMSRDTKQHAGDVMKDEYFMTLWNGKAWEEVSKMDPAGYTVVVDGKERIEKIEGTAGSSMTSIAMANGIKLRFEQSILATKSPPQRIRFSWHDAGLIAVIVMALIFAFTSLRSHVWYRRVFQVVLIGYLGLINGQILAQSLFAGWSASTVPWRAAPGLVLLMAAALVIPWATRRQLYCSQICPHGAAQEWMGRISRWRWRLPKGVDRGLRWLPPLLIGLVLFVTMTQVPFELAGIEPFDAYLIRRAGIATIVVAIIGLVAAFFVPMAYCKYGCPTGALLSFVRSHGKADGFGRRDFAAGLLVLLAGALYWWHEPVRFWIYG